VDGFSEFYQHESLFPDSTKGTLGQMIFGPLRASFRHRVYCSRAHFLLGNWVRKIRARLAGAWLAGASFGHSLVEAAFRSFPKVDSFLCEHGFPRVDDLPFPPLRIMEQNQV
jgi:hypothetical protein